jgi:asparagine N-glycosylation enzyme membrane subunit Stt3
MKITRYGVILAIILLLVLASRLLIAFQTEEFNPEAYFNLRQVEHITEKGYPLYDDDLSYSGRTFLFTPLFHYLLAFFNLFFPLMLVGKIIPNIFASLLVVITYFLARYATGNKKVALITAFFSGFIPVFFTSTINNVSVYTLAVPLIFTVIFFFLKTVKRTESAGWFLVFFILLVLTHSAAIILIISFMIYLILTKIESFKTNKREVEMTLFATFLTAWFFLIVYKKALLKHGTLVIWQNIPSSLLSSSFSQLTFFETIFFIGIIPLLLGVISVYTAFFVKKKKSSFVTISFAIVIFLLLWLRLIGLIPGLILLGVVLVLLSATSLNFIEKALSNTKISFLKNAVLILILLLFIGITIPSIGSAINRSADVPSAGELNALEWLKENTNESSIVAASIDEGFLISGVAERKNIMDKNFLLIPSINQRYNDLNTIFTTRFETEAVRKLNEYDVDYVFFSERAKGFYDAEKLFYVDDEDCFDLVYDKSVKIYEVSCTIR